MITIDLRPEIQSRPNYRLLIQIGILLAVGCGISYSIPMIYEKQLLDEAKAIEAKNAQKEQEIQRLKKELKTVEILKAKLAEINKRTQDIKRLGEGRKEPVVMLDQLQRQHLERMWLEAVKLEEQQVQLLGWSVDHAVVAEYARRLRQVNQELELEQIDLETFDPRRALMPEAFAPPPPPEEESEESEEATSEEGEKKAQEETNREVTSEETAGSENAEPTSDSPSASQEKELSEGPQKEKKELPSLAAAKDENLKNLSRIYGVKFDRVHIESANEEAIQSVPMQKFEISFAMERFSEEK